MGDCWDLNHIEKMFGDFDEEKPEDNDQKLQIGMMFLLDLLLGLQRKSKDCEKEYYKNKTQKSVNTEKPSLVSVTISLKQIRRLPGARRNHFDVCFPGYNGGQTVPQHLDTAPAN